MSDDEEKLLIRMEVTQRKFEKQLDAMYRKTKTTSQNMERSWSRSNRNVSNGMRNVGLQMNQVVQQTIASGDAMRALSIQLPDMLLGFGTFGIAAGAAAGALLPVITNMFETVAGAEELNDALKALKTSLDDISDADPLERALTLRRATIDAQELLTVLSSMGDVTAFGSGIRQLMSDLEITLGQANLLDKQLERIGEARGPDDLRAAIQETLDYSVDLLGNVDGMSDAQLDFVEGLRSALALFDDLEGKAASTEATIKRTAQQLYDMRNPSVQGGRGDGLAEWNARRGRGDTSFKPSREVVAEAEILLGNRSRTTSTPTAPTGATPQTNADAMEALRIIERTRTEAERYAIEMEKLNRLHAAGRLTTDQYNRAVADLGDQYGKTSDLAEDVTQTLRSGFIDVTTEIGSASDAVDSLANSLSRLLANKAFEAFIAPAFDAAVSTLLPGSGGGSPLSNVMKVISGARADGGPVGAGKTYLVGERGPELFRASASGSIVPNHMLGRTDPVVNMPITIHNEASNQVGVDVDRSSDGIRVFIRQQVRGMIGSGEMDQPMSRFGVRPLARGR